MLCTVYAYKNKSLTLYIKDATLVLICAKCSLHRKLERHIDFLQASFIEMTVWLCLDLHSYGHLQ